MGPTLDRTADTLGAQLRRRRDAAWRLPPLAHGDRDPLGRRHAEKLTGRELAAWRAAVNHLRGHDLGPMLPAAVGAALAASEPSS